MLTELCQIASHPHLKLQNHKFPDGVPTVCASTTTILTFPFCQKKILNVCTKKMRERKGFETILKVNSLYCISVQGSLITVFVSGEAEEASHDLLSPHEPKCKSRPTSHHLSKPHSRGCHYSFFDFSLIPDKMESTQQITSDHDREITIRTK